MMARRPIILYLLVYALVLAAMHVGYGFDVAEPLLVLLVFGVGLSLLALWTTRNARPRNITVKQPRQESAALAGYLVIVVGFITWGLPSVRLISAQPVLQAALVTIAKLLVLVIVPFAIWCVAWRYRVGEFVDLRAAMSGHWRPLVVLSIALVIVQAFLGRARADLASLHPSRPELLVAVGLTGAWLFIEVGVVEEFFFRGLVQARVAAFMGSELVGLVVMALVFGLAHAPGFYLRPVATGEALGAHPSILIAIGYSIVVTSVTGFFLGVLWIRTRNLLLLALIHAAGDLLPNLAGTIRLWRP
jgi:membrane protease YdiL (CAAX protease family)